jgi:hypothetical protein
MYLTLAGCSLIACIMAGAYLARRFKRQPLPPARETRLRILLATANNWRNQ